MKELKEESIETLRLYLDTINYELKRIAVRVKNGLEKEYHKALTDRKVKIKKEIAKRNSDYMKTISKKYTR